MKATQSLPIAVVIAGFASVLTATPASASTNITSRLQNLRSVSAESGIDSYNVSHPSTSAGVPVAASEARFAEEASADGQSLVQRLDSLRSVSPD